MNKIAFIRERTDMGITQPFICQTEEGEWFVVKTFNMMPLSQLLAEVIGSTLAAQLALPCPKTTFVQITPQAKLYAAPNWKKDLFIGTAFGSTYIQSAKIAKTAQAKNTLYLSEPAQKWLYMFDHWILNSDRTASPLGTGNINLLFDEKQKKILLIDHNLAFDEQADFSQHIFAPHNRTWRIDWVDRETFTDKAVDILKNFDDIYQSLPDDWFIEDEKSHEIEMQIDRIKGLLNRISEKHYWDNIE